MCLVIAAGCIELCIGLNNWKKNPGRSQKFFTGGGIFFTAYICEKIINGFMYIKNLLMNMCRAGSSTFSGGGGNFYIKSLK